MTQAGELQRFSFETSVDLVWKLDWEITRLLHASPGDIIDMKCFAYNAAVTAWQLAEWIFEDMTAEQKKSRSLVKTVDLQSKARRECRAVHICGRIATASKHRFVKQHHDPAITTAVRCVNVGAGFFPKWELLVFDGNVEHAASDVFEDARMYWYRLLVELGLIE